MLSFLFHTQKSTKSIKSTQKATKRISDFLPLRCFFKRIKTLPFLFFFAYMRFCAFRACEIFSFKKQNCPDTLIYITTGPRCEVHPS